MTKTACVVSGASPDDVRAFGTKDGIEIRANKLGTLITGKPGDLVIDLALHYAPAPVYDVMWNARTGWFAVTIYRGEQATRWDNRGDDDAGYPRVPDVLGATTPRAILTALDIPPDALDYAEA